MLMVVIQRLQSFRRWYKLIHLVWSGGTGTLTEVQMMILSVIFSVGQMEHKGQI